MKIFIFAFVFALAGCSQKGNTQKDLSSVFEAYWEEHSKLFPIDATQQGDNRFNDLLPNDQTAQYRKVLRDYFTDYLNRLKKFDRETLSESDRVSYDIFKYEMEMQIEGMNSDLYMIPFQQFWGLPLTLAQLGSGEQFQPFKTVQDYENWLKRAEGFTAWRFRSANICWQRCKPLSIKNTTAIVSSPRSGEVVSAALMAA